MERLASRPEMFRKYVDDGAPLLVWDGGEEGAGSEGFTIDPAVCISPTCPCREMQLGVRRIAGGAAGTVVEGAGPTVWVPFDIDKGEIVVPEGAKGDETAGPRIDALRAALKPVHVGHLRERWRRVKGQQRPDEWRDQDWSKIDLEVMVPYFDVFPSAWDLSAEHGGRRFWVMDYWCLVPGCGCNELRADVMGERGGSVGFVRVEAEGWKVVEVEGDRVAGEIWEALAADAHDRRMLEKRRLSMLRVARELPAFLGSSVASRRRGAAGAVGRNEPCPCGSGKKFKRCCGE